MDDTPGGSLAFFAFLAGDSDDHAIRMSTGEGEVRTPADRQGLWTGWERRRASTGLKIWRSARWAGAIADPRALPPLGGRAVLKGAFLSPCAGSLCRHMRGGDRGVRVAPEKADPPHAVSVPGLALVAPGAKAFAGSSAASEIQSQPARATHPPPAQQRGSGLSKLSWLGSFLGFGNADKPAERGRTEGDYWKERWINFKQPTAASGGPQNLAGWLQKVPGARPASVEYSSAGPGWLASYMGQLRPTTGKYMNKHLHRLLMEACSSSTMDFDDAKSCLAAHGRSAESALKFLRDIPDIRIDNSKSATAHYIYGSDPYLLGEDWPRSTVSVHDVFRRPYHRPRPSRPPGPPPPAPATSDDETAADVGRSTSVSGREDSEDRSMNLPPAAAGEQTEADLMQSCPVLFVTVNRAMHLPNSQVRAEPSA